MAGTKLRQMERIFGEAMEQPPGAREAFVRAECANDAELLQRVLGLLAAGARAGDFMASPTAGNALPAGEGSELSTSTAMGPLREGPGARIGPYKLLQLIGEGGFGAVFLAEQEQPVRRRVALKIIKLGMDTGQVVARFEQERQALALMDHPNIARVLDAGATPTGRPYFVMELVRGEPVTEYCDTNSLSTRERLELFAQVCNAVQHSHQKGVIHRDIKPGNVLVTVSDGKPIPKVIDFGIAKATSARLTEKTLFTEHRQLIGTPEYMSPEQAEMTGVDIDTRSDIFSLGVLLYELLTGTTPLDPKRLRSAAWAEMQRMIREEEPPTPSTRLSTLGDALARVATNRRTEPSRIGRLVRGELDWIVMKCLEKDRTRRYETANGLAMEVQRYLCDEPVLAGPPSTVYRLGKLVRRNLGVFLAGSAVLGALVLGLGLATYGLVQAKYKNDAKEAALVKEAAARHRAEGVGQFMGEVFAGVGPSVALGRDTRMLQEMMDAAAARIDAGELSAAPEEEWRLRFMIGSVYRGIAEWERSDRMLRRALELASAGDGPGSLEAAGVMYELGLVLRSREMSGEALPLLRRSLEIRRRECTGDDDRIVKSLEAIGWCVPPNQALPLYSEALAMAQRLHPGDHAAVAQGHRVVADCLKDLTRTADALVEYEVAVSMFHRLFPGGNLNLAAALSNQAICLWSNRQYDESLATSHAARCMQQLFCPGPSLNTTLMLHQESRSLIALGSPDEALLMMQQELARRKSARPGDDPWVAEGLTELGAVYRRLGREDKAIESLEAGAAMRARLVEQDPRAAITSLFELGRTLEAFNRRDDAMAKYRTALELCHRAWPGRSEREAATFDCMGYCFQGMGSFQDGFDKYDQALTFWRGYYDGDHINISYDLMNTALCLLSLEHFQDALDRFTEARDIAQRLGEPYRIHTAQMTNRMADCLTKLKNPSKAIEAHEHALEIFQHLASPDSADAASTLEHIGACYESMREPAEALGRYEQALAMRRRIAPGDQVDTAQSLAGVAGCLRALGKDELALAQFEEALGMRRRLQPRSHPDITRDLFNLAEYRTARAEMPQAEALLVEACERLAPPADAGDAPPASPQLNASIERLAAFYEAWDRSDPEQGHALKAAQWRSKLPMP